MALYASILHHLPCDYTPFILTMRLWRLVTPARLSRCNVIATTKQPH